MPRLIPNTRSLRRGAPIVAALGAVALTLGAAARSSAAADDAAAKPDPHAAVVQARQAGFRLQLAAFFQIKAAIARGDDVKTLVLPASAIAGWGKAIPAMFPPGSSASGTKALPTVWSDRAGFEAAAAEMTAAAAKLTDLAKAGDMPGFQTQYAALGKTCGDCHSKYRVEDKH